MSEESKKESKKKSKCAPPKAHPTAVMKKTLKLLREKKLPYEEAKRLATEEALKEGKYHGVSKMRYDVCCIVEDMKAEEEEKTK